MNRFNVSVIMNGEERTIGKDNAVELPFGVEYALKLTNNHPTLRAVCKLFIDGKEQSINGYCIQRAGSVIIERNSHTPNKFLFVSQGSKASVEAGHDPNNKEKTNGMVECRFYLEKERKTPLYEYCSTDSSRLGQTKLSMFAAAPAGLESFGPAGGFNGPQGSSGSKGVQPIEGRWSKEVLDEDCFSPIRPTLSKSLNVADTLKRCRNTTQSIKPGVTVAGGKSNKVYQKVYIDLEDQFVTLQFALRGSEE